MSRKPEDRHAATHRAIREHELEQAELDREWDEIVASYFEDTNLAWEGRFDPIPNTREDL